MAKYRNTSGNPLILSDGTAIAPGQEGEVSDETAKNPAVAEWMESGWLSSGAKAADGSTGVEDTRTPLQVGADQAMAQASLAAGEAGAAEAEAAPITDMGKAQARAKASDK